jgi:hypothetical protein
MTLDEWLISFRINRYSMKLIISKKDTPKIPVITLSIVLLAGLFLDALPPLLQTIEAQAQNSNNNNNNNSITISQIINQISTQVAKTNPGTNAAYLQQLISTLTTHTAQTSGQAKAIENIRQISLQVSTFPHGLVSQSLSQLVQQIANNTSNISPIIQQISLHKSSTKDISQAIVNSALQISNGGLSNISQQISLTAQLIAKQTGAHPAKIGSILKQLSIQSAKAGGSDLALKSLQQIISQINKNPTPNVPLIQAIGMLANSDDMGKTGQLLKIIKDIVKNSRDGKVTGSSGGGNKGDDGKKVV